MSSSGRLSAGMMMVKNVFDCYMSSSLESFRFTAKKIINSSTSDVPTVGTDLAHGKEHMRRTSHIPPRGLIHTYSQQHVTLYKTVKLHQLILNLFNFILEHRFDWEYLTVLTRHAVVRTFHLPFIPDGAAEAHLISFVLIRTPYETLHLCINRI
jgi:hypothetical protein